MKCVKSLQNWVLTLYNKIILPFCLPTLLNTCVIFLIPQDLWPPDLEGWWDKAKVQHQQSHVTVWSRSQVITWQMKNFIFPLSRGLWLPNLTRRWILMNGYYLQSHITSWLCEHHKPHDNSKNFCLHFQETCDHQT